MTLDASIPLQTSNYTKPYTRQELISLQDAATRSKLNQIQLANAQTDLTNRNALRDIQQAPENIDQTTGLLNTSGIAAATRVNPEYGFKLTEQARQLRLQDIAMAQKRAEVLKNLGTSYVTSYDRYLQHTGGNKDEATRLARQDTLNSVDEMERNGSLASMGLDQKTIAGLRNMPDPETARNMVASLGGKVEKPSPLSDVGKVEADYNAGRIDKKTRDEAIAKKNAPTLQMQMQNIDISPEDKAFWADIIRKGGTLPPGLARSAAGAKLVSEVMKEVPKGGTRAEDVLANTAEYTGVKAGQRTLGTRQANVDMAVTEAQNMAPLALQASANVDRTKYPTLNSLLLAAQKGTGDEHVVRLGIATNSLINIYARAISPTGVPTVSDKDHARELLSSAWSKGQYSAGIDQLMKEMAAAKKSPDMVREDLRRTMGAGAKESPKRRASDNIPADDEALINKYLNK